MENKNHINKISLAGLVITLGIVYGDIGTSPLYVMRAIVSGSGGISKELVLGAISCIFWTLTLQTTIKYIIITLRADNNGEGGILALYALIRRRAKWVFIFAIIGGSTLLADGIITPAITVVSAVEGLKISHPQLPILPIALSIIFFLFVIQQFGTNLIGKSLGPIMFIWFLMLGVLGMHEIIQYPYILNALNPKHAYLLLAHHPNGFLLLGAVFLCTTGAEALYSDLGHCGIKNIRITWIYVKITLVLNYLGQGAWLLSNSHVVTEDINPFYSLMPSWFLLPGIIIATAAAVIASQALISGSYTIISEAIMLNFWPKVKVNHPTTIKGQMYVPSLNWLLWILCTLVIIFFQESSKMEAAYGLSITITMLMTTLLLFFYFAFNNVSLTFRILFLFVYVPLEGAFLISNLNKFMHGGWLTIVIAGFISFLMYVWYQGRKIKNRFTEFVRIDEYFEVLKDLKADQSVYKHATNLVYLTRANNPHEVEAKIIYSIMNKQPKRADRYWLIHIDRMDEPRTMNYTVETLIPDTLIRVDFRLGFKIEPRVNLFFRQVVDELVRNKEIDQISKYTSLRKHHVVGDFMFIIIDRIQNYDFDFSAFEQFIMDIYMVLKKIGLSDIRAYGLDTSNVRVEKVPLQMDSEHKRKLNRIY